MCFRRTIFQNHTGEQIYNFLLEINKPNATRCVIYIKKIYIQ